MLMAHSWSAALLLGVGKYFGVGKRTEPTIRRRFASALT
jgi:hypothetical protein